MKFFCILIFSFFFLGSDAQSFLSEQKKYSRVRESLQSFEDTLTKQLNKWNCSPKNLEVYLRAHKYEEELEVWVKNKQDTAFQLFKTVPFCTFSGQIGPKRQQGDGQIPEGLYHIDRFNPYSSFYLSLGINYPNASDKKRGVKGDLGGDIFIHGSCVSIGCISITDPIIAQVYLLAVWAKNNGQRNIPVHIYPFKMKKNNLDWIREKLYQFKDYFQFWVELEAFYQYFERYKVPAEFTINKEGEYVLINRVKKESD